MRLTKERRALLRRIALDPRGCAPIHGLTWAALCARGLTVGDKRWPRLTEAGRAAAGLTNG